MAVSRLQKVQLNPVLKLLNFFSEKSSGRHVTVPDIRSDISPANPRASSPPWTPPCR